ncbi:MAG: DUF547 domain-containing protein [Cyclobacteriaceae bacterium]|nr:DUF547 domain-containing protein [Cyclobacteriaceae bacterium]
MKKLGHFVFWLLIVAPALGEAQSKPPSHEIFDRLLKKNVTADGKVNYKAFIKDSVELNRYLAILSSTPPDEKTWSKNEQMVFWINAYNAFTIKLITKYYPLKSIKDIGTGIQIPFVNTPWTVRFFKIGNDKMDLDNIEHGRLRKKFDDPRVHMALVCASKSCPILLNEAYDAKRMDEQMAKQATAFLADPFRNKMSADKPQLSMLFKWYGGDFNKKGGSVRGFINAHSPIKIKSDANISYLDYDWGLNEQ